MTGGEHGSMDCGLFADTVPQLRKSGDLGSQVFVRVVQQAPLSVEDEGVTGSRDISGALVVDAACCARLLEELFYVRQHTSGLL